MICAMDDCNNTLTPHYRLSFCNNCRASIGRWTKRPLADRLERRRKLHLYDNRMSEVTPKKKEAKK